MKYKLLKRELNGLYRIQALEDFGVVKKGDIGGYVKSEANLSQGGNCWVGGDARVSGNARVGGNALVTKMAINLIGLTYNITLTDKHIQIGCHQYTFKQALKLYVNWNRTLQEIQEASQLENEKDIIIALVRNVMEKQ